MNKEQYLKNLMPPAVIPEYDKTYTIDAERHPVSRVYHIHRDSIFEDLFSRLTKKGTLSGAFCVRENG